MVVCKLHVMVVTLLVSRRWSNSDYDISGKIRRLYLYVIYIYIYAYIIYIYAYIYVIHMYIYTYAYIY